MEDDFYVYIWTNKHNGKRYVGYGHGDRAQQHVRIAARKPHQSDALIVRALRKYGPANFELEIVVTNVPNDHAQAWERFYIDHYKTNVRREYEPDVFGYGYNQTDGGDGQSRGYVASDETRQKIRTAVKGKCVGPKNGMFGKGMSPEHKEKLRQANTGRQKSVEEREAIRARLRGQTSPMKGRRDSDETKARKSASLRRRHAKRNINQIFQTCFADPRFLMVVENMVSQLP